MQPNEANIVAQFLLPTVKREHEITRKVIAAVPAPKCTYTPDERSMTAIDLAWHLASSEWMFSRLVVDGAMPGGEGKRPEGMQTPEDVLKFYDETVAPVKAELSNVTPEQFAKVIDFHGMFQGPAVTYMSLMLNHSAHHRGQLSVYLRPMGVKVPGIYGPSGDEPITRPAKA